MFLHLYGDGTQLMIRVCTPPALTMSKIEIERHVKSEPRRTLLGEQVGNAGLREQVALQLDKSFVRVFHCPSVSA